MSIFTLIESLKEDGIFIEVDQLHNHKLFKVISHNFTTVDLVFDYVFFTSPKINPAGSHNFSAEKKRSGEIVTKLNEALTMTKKTTIANTGKSIFRLIWDIYDETDLELTLNPVKNHEIRINECVDTNIVPVLDAYFGKNIGSEFAALFSTNSDTLYEIRLTKTRPIINPDFAFNGSACSIPFDATKHRIKDTVNEPPTQPNTLPHSIQTLLMLAVSAQGGESFDAFYLVYKIIQTGFFKNIKIKKYLAKQGITLREWEVEFLKLAQKLYKSKITVDDFCREFMFIDIDYIA